jgi:cobalt/nickel transport system permease protein
METAQDAPYQVLPDYTVPFLGETAVSTILAGIIGVIIVASFTIFITRNLNKHRLDTKISDQ